MSDENKTKEQLISDLEKLRNEISRLKRIIALKENTGNKLPQSEVKFSSLMRVIPDTIYHIDPEGFFTYVSESVRFLDYEPSELIGKHFSEIIHPADVPHISRTAILTKYKGKVTGAGKAPKLFDERRTGERMTKGLEVRLLPKNWEKNKEKASYLIGTIYAHGEIDSAGNYDDPGTGQKAVFIGTVGVIRDIKDRKKKEEELLTAQKLESIGFLAGGIAHDFNNVLTAIIGNISLAKMNVDIEGPTAEALSDAEEAVCKARKLTSQLLTFSKGGETVKNAASISQLLMETCQFSLRGSNVKCLFDLADDLWMVSIDEGQIGQVIYNLVINAVQSMPEGGIIDLKAENAVIESEFRSLKPGRYVKIYLRDHGSGIPEDEINNIFDPYFTTRKYGSGLGLATSYSIIRSHDGYISAESEEGEGTAFSVYLPAADNNSSDAPQNDFILPSEGIRIMIMDDEESILEVTCKFLTAHGYDVTIVNNSEDAVKIFRERNKTGNCFNIVIMDLTIPGGAGGKEVIKRIREISPDIKAIVSSGYSHDPVLASYREFGFDGIAVKPYKLEELLKTIKSLLS